MSADGVFGWYYDVGVIGELHQLIARCHWVEVSRVDDVGRWTDAWTLDYASRYTLERRRLALIHRAVCVPTKVGQPIVYTVREV